jgi:hypothetical protein
MITKLADGEMNQVNIMNLNCKGNKLMMKKLTNRT